MKYFVDYLHEKHNTVNVLKLIIILLPYNVSYVRMN